MCRGGRGGARGVEKIGNNSPDCAIMLLPNSIITSCHAIIRLLLHRGRHMANRDVEDLDFEDKMTTAHEVIEHRLAVLWNAIDTIDTKTNIILGFASTLLIILAGFYSLGTKAWPTLSIVLFGLALVAYVTLLILSILSYRVRDWSYRPDTKTLLEHSKDRKYNKADIESWVATEYMSACYENLAMLKTKSRLTNLVLYAFAIETITLVSGLTYDFFIS